MARNGSGLRKGVAPAGTAMRFAQMFALMLIATAGLAATMPDYRDGIDPALCSLAAGLNEEAVEASGLARSFISQEAALQACFDRYESGPPPGLAAIAWPLLLIAATAVLFRLRRTWHVRRRGVRPVTDPAVLQRLRRRAKRLGLQRTPEFFVDWSDLKGEAIAFGSDRRPAVRLSGALVTRLNSDPGRVESVLLHEFAHLRNRDVTVTGLTTAMWWAFLAVVVAPWTVVEIVALPDLTSGALGGIELVIAVRMLLLEAVVLLLVHFARAEVLRDRELRADQTALAWGADLRRILPEPKQEVKAGVLARITRAAADLLLVHPSLRLRRKALDDSAELFAVRAPLVFMTGIAAVLIDGQIQTALRGAPSGAGLLDLAAALGVAGLVAGVVGISVWHASVHSVMSQKDGRDGIRAGLWLGAGFITGELLRGGMNLTDWIPPHPEFLVLLFGLGALWGWWTGACAKLWLGVWRGRRLVPVAVLVLGSGTLALASAVFWWRNSGLTYANGLRFDLAEVAGQVTAGAEMAPFDGPAFTAVGVFFQISALFGNSSLAWTAWAALWMVPLLAWACRPSKSALWIARHGARNASPGTPPLRVMLRATGIGTAATCVCIAAALALFRTWDGLAELEPGVVLYLYLAGAAFLAVLGAVAAAVVAAATARHHTLVAGLVAANLALAFGLAGGIAFAASDGCVAPIAVVTSECGAVPFGVAASMTDIYLVSVVLIAQILAVAAIAATAAVKALRKRARPPQTGAIPAPARLALTALCATVIALAVGADAADLQAEFRSFDPQTADTELLAEPAAPSSALQASQVSAWGVVGGGDLLERLVTGYEGLLGYLETEPSESDWPALRAHCEDLNAVAADAEQFFDVPVPEIHEQWSRSLDALGRAATACVLGIDQGNPALIDVATAALAESAALMAEALVALNEMRETP